MSCGLTQAVVHAEQLHFTPYRAKMRFCVRLPAQNALLREAARRLRR